jgi:cysteine-rich repeat protein
MRRRTSGPLSLLPALAVDEYGVVMHDRGTGVTTDVSPGGYEPVVSADGGVVAFASTRDDLVGGDDNGSADIVVLGDDEPSGRAGRCGDGVVGPGEACDDGNDRDGDGCESTCIPSAADVCSTLLQCAAERSSALPRPDDRSWKTGPARP